MIVSFILSLISIFIYYYSYDTGGFKKAFLFRIVIYAINSFSKGIFSVFDELTIVPIIILIVLLLIMLLIENGIGYFIYDHTPSFQLFALCVFVVNLIFEYLYSVLVVPMLLSFLIKIFI